MRNQKALDAARVIIDGIENGGPFHHVMGREIDSLIASLGGKGAIAKNNNNGLSVLAYVAALMVREQEQQK